MEINALLIYLISVYSNKYKTLNMVNFIYLKQMTVNQINMGNMKISHFCHISGQYADKCHFDLFSVLDLCIP